MALTSFYDGSPLTANFVNTLYNTGGGHVHDGISDDGHAKKVKVTDLDPWPIDRNDLGPIESGTFSGRLNQLAGATGIDQTFNYSLDDAGIATIWWPNLVAPTAYRSQRFMYQDFGSTGTNMPIELRPESAHVSGNQIVGTAMYAADEIETSPPSGALATTHFAVVKINTRGLDRGATGIQIEFLKDTGATGVWNDQISNTILAGQVSYQTGNFSV